MPPAASVGSSCPNSPATWQVASVTRFTSSARSSCTVRWVATVWPMLACVCVTPFGRLVLPEVNRIRAGSFGSTGASFRGTAAVSARHSASPSLASHWRWGPCGTSPARLGWTISEVVSERPSA